MFEKVQYVVPHSVVVRNVNHALPPLVILLNADTHVRRIAPRSGKETIELNAPLVTVLACPLERVLFSAVRDANPFFHFFEALWVLGGRNDVAMLEWFLPRMREFSDNGHTFHGAYGMRLRRPGADQLLAVVAELRANPASRRAVAAIWDADFDTGYTGKDMPCNCTLTFKIRDGRLHLTVFNRSNDMLWGAYGANVVQFSTIQEYVASMLGVPVGSYSVWSDSAHVYVDEPAWQRVVKMDLLVDDAYTYEHDGIVAPYPLVAEPRAFDTDLNIFLSMLRTAQQTEEPLPSLMLPNPYFNRVARPLFNALLAHRHKENALADSRLFECEADDWTLAAKQWMERRRAAR